MSRAPRFYRWLMGALPPALRRQFGDEIEALFVERLRKAGTRRARLRVWLLGLADLAVHSLAERSAVPRRRSGGRRVAQEAAPRSELVGSATRDVRFTLRGLRRSPGFTLVVILTLALGIGATAAVFSVVNALLLQPLPYADPQRLVAVWPQRNMNKSMVTRVAEGVPALESISGISVWTFVVAGDGAEPQEVEMALVSPHHFDLLGVAPMIGRAFAPRDAAKGGAGTVVLAYDFWATRYGADPGILGRQVRLSGADYDARTVIGVMPPGFRPVVSRRLAGWVPLEEPAGETLATDSSWYVNWTVGRLAPGATIEQAEAQLRALAPVLRSEAPSILDEEDVRTISIEPLQRSRVGKSGGILWLLLGTVSLVLLIACANVANLQLARGETRSRELAVRRALGAGSGRLIRQLLTESTVLAVTGGVLGVALAYVLLPVLLARVPSDFPLPAEVRMAPTLRQLIWQVDDETAIADLDSMAHVIGESAATVRFVTLLLGSFGLLALALGAVGVYGVTAYTVARRTGEFGVRVALGAMQRQILGSALVRGLLPVAAGVAAGAVAAAFGTRLLRELLFGVEPHDPLTFAAVVVLLGLVGAAATLVPAWRATRVDPAEVLRAE